MARSRFPLRVFAGAALREGDALGHWRWPESCLRLVSERGRLTPRTGIVGHGVDLAQMVEQRGQRRELAPDRCRAAAGTFQMFAPGQKMRAGDFPEMLRILHAEERHEPGHIVAVRAPRVRIADIGEPLQLRRHIVELIKARVGEFTSACGDHDQFILFGVHLPCSKGDNAFYQP